MGSRGPHARPLPARFRQLTPLERKVSEYMTESFTAAELGELLSVTPRSIRNARRRLVELGHFKIVDPGCGRGRRAIFERVQ